MTSRKHPYQFVLSKYTFSNIIQFKMVFKKEWIQMCNLYFLKTLNLLCMDQSRIWDKDRMCTCFYLFENQFECKKSSEVNDWSDLSASSVGCLSLRVDSSIVFQSFLLHNISPDPKKLSPEEGTHLSLIFLLIQIQLMRLLVGSLVVKL